MSWSRVHKNCPKSRKSVRPENGSEISKTRGVRNRPSSGPRTPRNPSIFGSIVGPNSHPDRGPRMDPIFDPDHHHHTHILGPFSDLPKSWTRTHENCPKSRISVRPENGTEISKKRGVRNRVSSGPRTPSIPPIFGSILGPNSRPDRGPQKELLFDRGHHHDPHILGSNL